MTMWTLLKVAYGQYKILSITRVPDDHCACCCLRRKSV